MRCHVCDGDVSSDARFCTKCGSPLGRSASGDPWLGRTIAGRFTLLRLLGEGGIGRVYLAEQPMGNARRQLAVKMLLPQHSSKPEMIRRFLRECELLSQVEHPNVVRIYDFGEAEPSTFFIAMELVLGESLGEVLRRQGALAVHRTVHIVSEIGRALSAAHDAGIIHRDLKPDNVMVFTKTGEPDTVKVLDFGIAKSVQEPTQDAGIPQGEVGGNVTAAGAIVGTPRYMSPEQFLGTPLDARTDVYALALITYETLTGTSPFQADNAAGWATAHVAGVPRPFEERDAGAAVPVATRALILRALAKRPDERPASARDFVHALERSVGDAAVMNAPAVPRIVLDAGNLGVANPALAPTVDDVPAVDGKRSASRRSRRWAVGAAISALVLGGAIALVALRSAQQSSRLRDTACERVMQTKSCEAAKAALEQCPESAGHLHEHAHTHRDNLCGE